MLESAAETSDRGLPLLRGAPRAIEESDDYSNLPGKCCCEELSCLLLFWVALSNLHVTLICSSRAIIADSCQACRAPYWPGLEEISQMAVTLLMSQEERKENRTNQPLFLILDNGFSKALGNHLSTLPAPR